MFNNKNKRFRLLAVVGFLLLLVGLGLYLYSSFKVNELQQILNDNSLTTEDYWSYHGSFDWWKNSSETLFFPLMLVLVCFGALLLLFGPFTNLRNKNFNLDAVIPKTSKKAISTNDSLDETIIRTIVDKKPETVKQLVESVHEETNIPQKTVLDRIVLLEQAKKIKLTALSGSTTSSTVSTVVKAKWYWITMAAAGICIFFVLQVPETVYPLVYGRYIFGSLFVLLLPGHSLIRALYVGKQIDNIERLGLSIVLSIGLAGIVSFFLNFSPWKITFLPVVLCLSVLVILFATVGFVKELWSNDE